MYLLTTLFAYNTAIYLDACFSANFLTYGQEPRISTDLYSLVWFAKWKIRL